MSMISGQVDRLRTAAQTYRRLGNHSAESMLLDAADTIWKLRDDLQRANAENAELREQMERLVTLLRADCDIEASWDGLRKFWSIGLTENGCLMRDRACKAEADNAKLRELLTFYLGCLTKGHVNCDSCAFSEDVCEHGRKVIDWARDLGVGVDA